MFYLLSVLTKKNNSPSIIHLSIFVNTSFQNLCSVLSTKGVKDFYENYFSQHSLNQTLHLTFNDNHTSAMTVFSFSSVPCKMSLSRQYLVNLYQKRTAKQFWTALSFESRKSYTHPTRDFNLPYHLH